VILAPLDPVSAHPWHYAVFTTYVLSLSFFEAVVLEALGQERRTASVDSRRCEWRPRQHYEVEPVAVSSGVFHP